MHLQKGLIPQLVVTLQRYVTELFHCWKQMRVLQSIFSVVVPLVIDLKTPVMHSNEFFSMDPNSIGFRFSNVMLGKPPRLEVLGCHALMLLSSKSRVAFISFDLFSLNELSIGRKMSHVLLCLSSYQNCLSHQA